MRGVEGDRSFFRTLNLCFTQLRGFDSPAPSYYHKFKIMVKSETIKELATALAKFQAAVPRIDLDREVEVSTKTGGKYKFKYATFANIIDKIKQPLSDNGLSFTQLVNEDGGVTTILMHSSGEYISSTLVIKGENTPQGIGSTITYSKRYALSSILGICADDDDDANAGQGNEYKMRDTKKEAKSIPSAAKGKKVVPVEKLKTDEFLQALHDLEKKKREAGEHTSPHAILETNYILTPNEIKEVCLALGDFEKRTNQVELPWETN